MKIHKIRILLDDMIRQFEIDYSDDTEKPMLKPRNNREYWLFTETHQMLKDFQKKVKDIK